MWVYLDPSAVAIARKHLVDPDRSGCYHVVSRCVRRAFLCGDGYEHRRDWIATTMEQASRCFSAEILGFAIMHNHLHLVVKTHKTRTHTFQDTSGRRYLHRALYLTLTWMGLFRPLGRGHCSQTSRRPGSQRLLSCSLALRAPRIPLR